MIPELGAQASAEMIMFLSISVCVILGILTQVIESLGIRGHSESTLSECQKLIQFPFHKTFRNMVSSECILEFFPSNYVISWQHSIVVVPPKTSRIVKLLCGKAGLVCIRTWQHQ